MITTETPQPKQTPSDSRNPTLNPSFSKHEYRSSSFSRWNGAIFLFMTLTLETLLGGLFFLKHDLQQSWLDRSASFAWLVLAGGSNVDIDELGGLLRKGEHVRNVRLISERDIRTYLRGQGVQGEIEDFNFPKTWEVKWNFENFDFRNHAALLDEVKRYPGVIDIAYSQQNLNDLMAVRKHWHLARIALSLFMFFGFLSLFVLLGRAFFMKPIFAQKGTFWLTKIMQGLLIWGAGYLLLTTVLGPISPLFILLGLIPGLVYSSLNFNVQ